MGNVGKIKLINGKADRAIIFKAHLDVYYGLSLFTWFVVDVLVIVSIFAEAIQLSNEESGYFIISAPMIAIVMTAIYFGLKKILDQRLGNLWEQKKLLI